MITTTNNLTIDEIINEIKILEDAINKYKKIKINKEDKQIEIDGYVIKLQPLETTIVPKLVLKNTKYKMSELYPNTYQTMNSFVADIDVSACTVLDEMFKDCLNISSLDLSKLKTSHIVSMKAMFLEMVELTSLNVDFDVSNCRDMSFMFSQTSLETLNLFNFNTENVETMQSMFDSDEDIVTLDLSNFRTPKLTNCAQMFSCCYSLHDVDMSNFDFSKVTDFCEMFYDDDTLVSIKGIIDMKNCEDCTDMFYNCINLKNVKIKNPPSNFARKSKLKTSQYVIVTD